MMPNHGYPEGIDCTWLAIDNDGYIAAFVTAGVGPIPKSLLTHSLSLEQMDIEGKIWDLPRTCDAVQIGVLDGADDFLQIAERGIFAFDWTEAHRIAREQTRAYEFIAAPAVPALVTQISPKLAAIASATRFHNLKYAAMRSINIRESFTFIVSGIA